VPLDPAYPVRAGRGTFRSIAFEKAEVIIRNCEMILCRFFLGTPIKFFGEGSGQGFPPGQYLDLRETARKKQTYDGKEQSITEEITISLLILWRNRCTPQ